MHRYGTRCTVLEYVHAKELLLLTKVSNFNSRSQALENSMSPPAGSSNDTVVNVDDGNTYPYLYAAANLFQNAKPPFVGPCE